MIQPAGYSMTASTSFWERMRSSSLELGAGVLLEQDLLARLDLHRLAAAVVQRAAGANGQDGALLRALLGGVGNDDAALGHLLPRYGLDDEPVAERLEGRRGPTDRSGHQCVVPPCMSPG